MSPFWDTCLQHLLRSDETGSVERDPGGLLVVIERGGELTEDYMTEASLSALRACLCTARRAHKLQEGTFMQHLNWPGLAAIASAALFIAFIAAMLWGA